MRHFCTYFDRNYLLRGLTLFRSLLEHESSFVLHVLALDDETLQCINALRHPSLTAVALHDVETVFPELTAAKVNRSRIEYYFTLSPFFPRFILERDAVVDTITYLDADLCFYESLDPIFAELGNRSILICEHRYSDHLPAHSGDYGRFNVQFQVFRRDEAGLSCLERWSAQCGEWCHDYPDNGRYADQKYLDEWPELYGPSLAILQHPGAGVAPWNWSTNPMSVERGRILVKGEPLVFFHFHGVKIFGSHFISNGLADWGMMPRRLRAALYGDYVRRIRATRSWVLQQTTQDYPMKDNFIRGKGIALASASEIFRKAWRQAMFVP